jgi:hypothetical protein
MPFSLFRRHVGWRSEYLARDCRRTGGAAFRLSHTSNSEIDEFNQPILPQHDIGRLNISMQDAALMSERKRRSDLPGYEQRLGHRHWTAADPGTERLSVDVFHDNEPTPIDIADFINRHDVRVVERGSGACFLLESSDAFRIDAESPRQNLQSDLPAELEILGEIDMAHAAGAKKFQEAVMTDLGLNWLGPVGDDHAAGRLRHCVLDVLLQAIGVCCEQ